MSTRREKVTYFDDPVKVGQRLREARQKAGLSQRALAFPGCTYAYLSRMEQGDRTPSLQLLRELARRLNVSEEYLAWGREPQALGTLQEAELALRMDEAKRAEELYRQALEQGEEAEALVGLGRLAFRAGNSQQAVELLERALELEGDEGIANDALVDALARAYGELSDLEASIALLERALAASEEREDLLASVRHRIVLSAALSDAGQLPRAGEVLAEALRHSDELADPVARIRLYWAQCRLHLLKGRPDLAARYGQRVLDLLELTEDSFSLARAYRLMAHVELDRNEPAQALELLQKSRVVLGEQGSPREQAAIRVNEARALAALGRLEEAGAIAMETAGSLGDDAAEAGRSYALLADTFAEAGDRERAIELAELACQLLEEHPNRYLVEAYSSLANLLEAEGRKDEAFAILQKAVSVQSRSGLVPGGRD